MARPLTLPRPQEIDLGGGFDPWGFQRPLKWWDTENMIEEEVAIIDHVRQHAPVKLWTLLGTLSKRGGRKHKFQSRPERQKLTAVFTRLCREAKLVRDRPTNLVTLGRALGPRMYPDVTELRSTPHGRRLSSCDSP